METSKQVIWYIYSLIYKFDNPTNNSNFISIVHSMLEIKNKMHFAQNKSTSSIDKFLSQNF